MYLHSPMILDARSKHIRVWLFTKQLLQNVEKAITAYSFIIQGRRNADKQEFKQRWWSTYTVRVNGPRRILRGSLCGTAIMITYSAVDHVVCGLFVNEFETLRKYPLFGTKPLSKPIVGYCELYQWEQNLNVILIELNNFSFAKMHMKILSAKWRPFCPGKEEPTLAFKMPCQGYEFKLLWP